MGTKGMQEYGPTWHDVNLAITEFKKTHQRFCEVTIGHQLGANGYPQLYVRFACWQGYNLAARVNERGVGEPFPNPNAKTMPALIYGLVLALDAKLTEYREASERQSAF